MLKNCLHIVAFKNNLIKIIKLSCRLVFYPNTKCLKTIKLYVTRNQTMCSFTQNTGGFYLSQNNSQDCFARQSLSTNFSQKILFLFYPVISLFSGPEQDIAY